MTNPHGEYRLWPARDILVRTLSSIGETTHLGNDDMAMLLAESHNIRTFRRKWRLSRDEREVRQKANRLGQLSYDIHADHEGYRFAPVVATQDILSVSYRMATGYGEMVDVLDSLIDIHTLFHKGIEIGPSDIGDYPTILREPVDIGLSPQHPIGFVGFIALLYGMKKSEGGFALQRPLLLPRDRRGHMEDPMKEYEERIDSRTRIGVTHRFAPHRHAWCVDSLCRYCPKRNWSPVAEESRLSGRPCFRIMASRIA